MSSYIRVILATSALALIARNAQADCAACTVSKGVTIQLKSGGTEKGYVLWNNFMAEQLPDGFGIRKDPAAHSIIARLKSIKSSEEFDYWLELVNFIGRRDYKPLPNWPIQGITVYRRLVKISNPFERYVGIKNEVINIPFNAIRGIVKNPDFPLHVNTTGIDVLASSDIDQLSEQPRFMVQVEGSVGGSAYVVYGDKVTLTQVLEHGAAHSGGDLGAVLVNGLRIRGGSGAGQGVPLSEAPQLGPLREECKAFLERLDEVDRASCEKEHAATQGLLDSMPLDSPARAALFDRQHQLRATCMRNKGTRAQPKWASLGKDEDIRRLGIIVTHYGWD